MLCQLRQGFRQHIQAGPGRNVIQDAGNVAGIRDGGEAGDQAPLGGFVIIRRYQQHRVRAGTAGSLCPFNGMGSIVGSGARDDRNLSGNTFHAEYNSVLMLFVRKGASLTGCTCDNKRADSPGKLIINQPAESIPINPLFGEGGDNGGCRACKDRVLHTGTPPE